MQGFALLVFCACAFVATALLHLYCWLRYQREDNRRQIAESTFVYSTLVIVWGYCFLSSLIELAAMTDTVTKIFGIAFLLICMTTTILLTQIEEDQQST